MTARDKPRLDQLLVEKGLVETRSRAQALILAGKVRLAGQVASKPGERVAPDSDVEVAGPDHPYVSRGGLKLQEALEGLEVVDFGGKDVLDVGASTGGFTDCLLQHGANRVIALDVGYGQLHWKLRQDPRVFVMERTNIRYVTADDLPFQPQGAVVDVSFISLRLVLPVLARLLPEAAPVVVLVKPQFEAGRGQVGKGGVVRDEAVRREVVETIRVFAQKTGFEVLAEATSPVLGPKGNKEFLLALRLVTPGREDGSAGQGDGVGKTADRERGAGSGRGRRLMGEPAGGTTGEGFGEGEQRFDALSLLQALEIQMRLEIRRGTTLWADPEWNQTAKELLVFLRIIK